MPIDDRVLRKRLPGSVAAKGGQRRSWAGVRQNLAYERAGERQRTYESGAAPSTNCGAAGSLRRPVRSTRDGAHRGQVEKQRPWVELEQALYSSASSARAMSDNA